MKTSQIIEKFKNKAQGFDQRVRLGESMLGSRFVQSGKGLAFCWKILKCLKCQNKKTDTFFQRPPPLKSICFPAER